MAIEQSPSKGKVKPYFHPSVPHPSPPITKEQRVAVLRRALDSNDPLYLAKQSVNIQHLITLYESGELRIGEEAYIMAGEKVTCEACKASTIPYFHEVSLTSFT